MHDLYLSVHVASMLQDLKDCRRLGARTIADAEALESDRSKQKAKGGQTWPGAQRGSAASLPPFGSLGASPLAGEHHSLSI